jgi:arylsulfatase A-like enzyme
LWTWLQSQDEYRDKTTILITTDHGRGNTPADWGTHGAKIEGAQYTWLAAIGPDFPKRGEWRDTPAVHPNQIAATMSTLLGVGADFTKAHPNAGKPIDLLLAR